MGSGKVKLVDTSGKLQFAIEYHYFVRDKGEYFVRLGVAVPCAALRPKEKGGKVKDLIVFQFTVTDSTGKAVFAGEGKAPIEAPVAEFASMRERNSVIEYVQRFDLKPGNYNITITATEDQTARKHAQTAQLFLPSREGDCPNITRLFSQAKFHLRKNARKARNSRTTATSSMPTSCLKSEPVGRFCQPARWTASTRSSAQAPSRCCSPSNSIGGRNLSTKHPRVRWGEVGRGSLQPLLHSVQEPCSGRLHF